MYILSQQVFASNMAVPHQLPRVACFRLGQCSHMHIHAEQITRVKYTHTCLPRAPLLCTGMFAISTLTTGLSTRAVCTLVSPPKAARLSDAAAAAEQAVDGPYPHTSTLARFHTFAPPGHQARSILTRLGIAAYGPAQPLHLRRRRL